MTANLQFESIITCVLGCGYKVLFIFKIVIIQQLKCFNETLQRRLNVTFFQKQDLLKSLQEVRQEKCFYNSPMVGMVVTISPSFSLYKIVVFPAKSSPTIKIRISFLPKRLWKSFANTLPMSILPNQHLGNLHKKTQTKTIVQVIDYQNFISSRFQ